MMEQNIPCQLLHFVVVGFFPEQRHATIAFGGIQNVVCNGDETNIGLLGHMAFEEIVQDLQALLLFFGQTCFVHKDKTLVFAGFHLFLSLRSLLKDSTNFLACRLLRALVMKQRQPRKGLIQNLHTVTSIRIVGNRIHSKGLVKREETIEKEVGVGKGDRRNGIDGKDEHS